MTKSTCAQQKRAAAAGVSCLTLGLPRVGPDFPVLPVGAFCFGSSLLVELVLVLRWLMLVFHHKLPLHLCGGLHLLGRRRSQELLQVVRATASWQQMAFRTTGRQLRSSLKEPEVAKDLSPCAGLVVLLQTIIDQEDAPCLHVHPWTENRKSHNEGTEGEKSRTPGPKQDLDLTWVELDQSGAAVAEVSAHFGRPLLHLHRCATLSFRPITAPCGRSREYLDGRAFPAAPDLPAGPGTRRGPQLSRRREDAPPAPEFPAGSVRRKWTLSLVTAAMT